MRKPGLGLAALLASCERSGALAGLSLETGAIVRRISAGADRHRRAPARAKLTETWDSQVIVDNRAGATRDRHRVRRRSGPTEPRFS